MSVDRAEVEAMARLARLKIEENEADRLAVEMTRVLDFADRLRTVSPPSTGTSRSLGPHSSPGADDVDGGAVKPDPLLAAPADFAPDFSDGFFLVPPPPGVTPDAEEHTRD